jgi:glycosyltransferase involved in cell wall biosynthesis
MQPAICVITEDLSFPIDEGIRHFAGSLIEGWSREHRVLGLSVRSRGKPATSHTISLRTNKFFLSYRLYSTLRRFQPDVICYVPSASATIFSFLRARMLKLYYPSARVVMVSLQPRRHGWLSRRLIRWLAPEVIFVQNEAAMQQLTDLGCKVNLLASGVDLNKFAPVSRDRKKELRAKYGLDTESFTVLHVGHITGLRNIDLLSEVRGRNAAQVILVGSRLVHPDRAAVAARLKEQGIIIFDEYLGNIEEIYQLADCYLFPVFSDRSSIGTPLSVLEAMACNLPVVTVRFGLLPRLFSEELGFYFADTPEGLIESVAKVKDTNGCHTREQAAAYSWEKVAGEILKQTGIHKDVY